MTGCCPHEEDEHHLLPTCQEVIHYPSEDYPCLCTHFAGDGAKCDECGHVQTSHIVMRVCKPDSGGHCECRRLV